MRTGASARSRGDDRADIAVARCGGPIAGRYVMALTEAVAIADAPASEKMSQPDPPNADEARPAIGARVVATMRDKVHTFDCAPGETIVQAAVRHGIYPPFSCLQGICATCLARLTQGSVEMIANAVLSPDEVAEGYVLTCQSVPTAGDVAVVYEM